jgi:excisionase family DNA binding protein
VLTLAEAAAYLRVAEKDVLDLATRKDLPGRKIGDKWRFLKQALAEWLRASSPKDLLMRHAGVAKGDPYFDEMLKTIYEERGRSLRLQNWAE